MRKLLILLLLPIVTILSMGSASLSTVADAATAPAAVVTEHVAPATLPLTGSGGVALPTKLDDGCSYSNCMTAEERDSKYGASLYLPLNRWTNMDYHSRVNWWSPVEATNASSSRFFAGTLMNFGNGAWKVASDWSRGAMEFNPFNSGLGFQVDKVAGVLGNAITGKNADGSWGTPVLFALILVGLLIIIMWRAMRRPGTKPFGKLLQAALVFGIILLMSTQAAAGTRGGGVVEDYKPRVGSPVWTAGAVTGTIDGMASTAVAAVQAGMLPILTSTLGTGSATGWSCTAMIDGSFRAAGKENPSAGAEAVARSMNSMWIATAYNTYAVVQFGDSNPYAKEVACRQLERLTTADGYTRTRMLSQSLYKNMSSVSMVDPSNGTPFQTPDAPMLKVDQDTEANDAAMIAWAACQPKNNKGTDYTVRTGWGKTKTGDTWITADDCKAAFAATDAEGMKKAGDGVFNIEDANAAREKTADDAVLNYISTLQGKDQGVALGSITSSIIFLIGAIIGAGIFGIMALAVLCSKIFMLLLVTGMFFLLILSLFKDDSFGQVMQRPAFRFLGVTIFAFGSTLLLAVLATFALITSSMATMFGPAGSIGAIIWVSVSPIIAVIAVHFLFTKLFKMPSPVTAKGALAWGTAGGAVGGAVGAGLMNRMQNRGAAMARGAGRKALASNKYTGWMVNGKGGAGASRKGAGDAGTRDGREVGEDITSESLGRPTGTGKGEGVSAKLAASEGAVAEATKYLSEDTKRDLIREAKSELREQRKGERGARRAESFGTMKDRVSELGAKLTARHDAKAALLAGEVAATGDDGDALLSEKARAKVSFVNRDPLADFLTEPGSEPTTVAAIPAVKWKDLSSEGKAQASVLAAKARAEKREQTAALAKERAANVVRSSGQFAQNLPATMKSAAVGTAKGVAALGTPEGRQNAAAATVSAARATTRATAVGAEKTREVTKKASDIARSAKARSVVRTSAAAVGATALIAGAPVAGAVLLAGAAGSQRKQWSARREQTKEQRQTQLNEILAAKALAHKKKGAPSTSTVSDAAPVAPKKD